jgi:NTP pyrophosphatase (non-canonical NTP hydrolase)
MEANKYQDWTVTTAIYPGAGLEDDRELTYLALGLSGEAGEVADKIKKYLRDGKLDIGGIVYELGDVCWYIARLADALGYDFEDLLTINHAKLEDRKARAALQGSGDAR